MNNNIRDSLLATDDIRKKVSHRKILIFHLKPMWKIKTIVKSFYPLLVGGGTFGKILHDDGALRISLLHFVLRQSYVF